MKCLIQIAKYIDPALSINSLHRELDKIVQPSMKRFDVKEQELKIKFQNLKEKILLRKFLKIIH